MLPLHLMQMLISGPETPIDITDLRAHTRYSGETMHEFVGIIVHSLLHNALSNAT